MYEQIEMSCDGLDNDCDGLTDEEPLDGWGDCLSELEGPCRQGRLLCKEGALSCEPVELPQNERCDQIDNDCDGLADEGLTVGLCSSGQGACTAQGEALCIGGYLHL